ncbi:MAG: helix-turn-helix transcriptional regulator [Treponema sp.]|nr:helix-turn-helix transcriptional regulator [Treponema sp.]
MQGLLTEREQVILELLLKGLNPKEIAFSLNIKYSTVDYHKSRIYRKLKVQSIQELFIRYGKSEADDSADDSESTLANASANDKPNQNGILPYSGGQYSVNADLNANAAGNIISYTNADRGAVAFGTADNKAGRLVPALIAALAVSLLLNAAMIYAYIRIAPDYTEKLTKEFASVEEPLVITLIYGQPGGYNYNFHLFDCFVPQLFEGEVYTLYYTLTTDRDMNDLSIAFVDRSDEASEGCWVSLTDAPIMLHAIKANVVYKNAIRIRVIKSAYSDRTISNLIEFGTDNMPDKPPVLTFTRFEIVKEK